MRRISALRNSKTVAAQAARGHANDISCRTRVQASLLAIRRSRRGW